jgi:putative ABC transport system substrate-binding protein
MSTRREFITLLGGAAAAWPLAARAQQPERVRRIGVLMGLAENDPEGQARVAAFRQGLEQLRWTDGRNARIDYRWAAGEGSRAVTYAAELVALSPDVIFAGAVSALAPLQSATKTIPIVFAQVSDPVGGGFVVSLARPGGNITGFTQYEYTTGVKWLELLKEIAPGVARVAFLYDPANPTSAGFLRTIEPGTPSLGVQVSTYAVRETAEFERAIDAFAAEPNGGLIILPSLSATIHRELIVAGAARHRLPVVYPYRLFATSGGLASYGVDNIDMYRRAAGYVDRILKGASPAELPVQQATKFELIVNLKTARALGLEVPPTLLARADEVIE